MIAARREAKYERLAFNGCYQLFLPGHHEKSVSCQKAIQRELKAPTGFAGRQPAIAQGLSLALASQLIAQREVRYR
jgi:hypothetical protein